MPYQTVSLGLTLTIPTNGTRNWGTIVLNEAWKKISQHTHSGGGDGNQIPTGGLANNSVTTAKLSKNYGWTQASTLTPAGTTQTIDFNNGNVQVLDLDAASGNVTLTLSNPAAGSLYTIFIIQAATPLSLVWPASVKWPQAQAIIQSQTNNARDVVQMYYDGTNYLVTGWDLDIS